MPTDPPEPQHGDGPDRGIEFGWRVHSAQESWTAKVDGKASLLLALQGGALFVVAVGRQKDGFLYGLTGWQRWLEACGSIGLVVGIIATILAVVPQLGRTRNHVTEHRSHLVYFGHLRHWEPYALSAELAQITAADELRMLGQQLVRMSEINWRKHQSLRVSLIVTMVDIVAITAAVIFG